MVIKSAKYAEFRAGCKVMKTRYAKPFEGVQVKIPRNRYESYSGLLELFEKKGLIVKSPVIDLLIQHLMVKNC